MHDDDEGQFGEFDFSLEGMTTLARGGAFPPGYLDAYLVRQQARHARLDGEIKAAFAAASTDPKMMARLNRPLP